MISTSSSDPVALGAGAGIAQHHQLDTVDIRHRPLLAKNHRHIPYRIAQRSQNGNQNASGDVIAGLSLPGVDQAGIAVLASRPGRPTALKDKYPAKQR